MKRCPVCAERVQNAARKCRHCSHEFPPGQSRPGCGALLPLGLALLFVTSQINRVFGGEADNPEESAVAKASARAAQSDGPAPYKVMILAERRLKETLRDPWSAEIRNTIVPSGSGYLCGEVNATNGFGGKTGFRRFVAGATSQMPVVIEGELIDASEFEKLWTKAC